MEANVYAPPATVVAEVPVSARAEYYVVSRGKFLALFFATFGLYQLYWFYRHWANYRAVRHQDLWPVARAVFAIFFTHALVDEIEGSLSRQRIVHRWSPRAIATAYVLLQILMSICDRLSWRGIGSPITDLVSFGCLVPIGWCLWQVQRAANLACNSADGADNARLTPANWFWLIFGAVLWALALLGLLLGDVEPA